jgi:hypothetical protein
MNAAALPPVHIVVMQPLGYVHSLGLLDPARYLRHQLRRFGAEVTLAKNRLREDALNVVFGAHLGFDPSLRERHACVFVNLEQLGGGGAEVKPEYLELLRTSGVADYDPANVPAYAADPTDVPLLPLLHAPYLEAADTLPLSERPIDLLFFGSMNPRRRAFIDRIETTGVEVSLFDRPVYGPERDAFIRQAKAVLNCHFYDSARFEQVRAQHCLSLGTPVISERPAGARTLGAFEDTVFWLDPDPQTFFAQAFDRPPFFDEAHRRLAAWRCHDPVDAYADFMAFAAGYFQGHGQSKPKQAWRPTQLHIGSGKDYRPGWLNVDVLERAHPDLLLDLSQPQTWPLCTTTRLGAPLELTAGSLQTIKACHVLEHVPDLPTLMTNLLALLQEGGEVEIEVPYERAPAAWQDPTHVRAMNENSWLYYTDWFWYLGWFEHRFEIAASSWLDLNNRPCAQEQASFMQLTLRKIPTSPHERTVARTMAADFDAMDDGLEAQEHEAIESGPTRGVTGTIAQAPVADAAAELAAAH